ncbi:WXG100 family type VII secretion target [Paractinoplanes lichenicola]|uniref:ESAT-6-like protein n=1 Tax=Paractinoplanes lichenicola TaxID=2802976 RepID=A0ABS1W2J4_9ACTN|nr:WXG100 family type VII secretion target [Actinoplanes lichenicola]MBL7260955.1 WXG100 family type VII secretion target [Actinoplanes lichenicola]
MANDGVLLVNFEALRGAGANIAKAVSSLQQQLGDLERDSKRLVDSWDGEAQQAYYARQEAWRTAANDLTSILQNIKGAVDQSADDYVNTEKQATSRFQ